MTDKPEMKLDEKNQERHKFLEGKPTYNCRFHPTDWWHEVGCPHQEWTKEQLQNALDMCKRSKELALRDRNEEYHKQQFDERQRLHEATSKLQ